MKIPNKTGRYFIEVYVKKCTRVKECDREFDNKCSNPFQIHIGGNTLCIEADQTVDDVLLNGETKIFRMNPKGTLKRIKD